MQPRQRRSGGIIPSARDQAVNDSSEDEEEQLPQGPTYAPLHDFCLMIPYGLASMLTGSLQLLLLNFGFLGWLSIGNGAALTLLALLSLRSWTVGNLSKAYSIAGIAVTFPAWFVYYNSLHMHGLPMLHARVLSMAAMSGILMFMFVNVIMGGNPPRGHKKQRPKAA